MNSGSNTFTHIAYADETKYNKGTFPGIALVSLPYQFAPQINQEIGRILQESNVDEFKWSRLHSAKRRFTAVHMIDYTIKQVTKGVLRIDVLTWDMADERHNVTSPDKIANLQRMYYHLFRNVLRARWPDEAIWRLCPDEHTAMSWPELQTYLDQGSLTFQNATSFLPSTELDLMLKREFHIHAITPCRSEQEPLVQLADLFVGIGSYSRACFDRYQQWQQTEHPTQKSLLNTQNHTKLSHADRVRCYVLERLNHQCKMHKLGVSLKTYRGLRTLDPRNPINFWWYIPQHNADKAPQKQNKTQRLD